MREKKIKRGLKGLGELKKKKLHPFLEKIEYYNSKLIFLAIILLLALIIIELFFAEFSEKYHLMVSIFDYIIITIFVIDLIFLALRSKNTTFFFKNYWLDILAVFPFTLLFRTIESFYLTISSAEKVLIGQSIFHETLEARKGLRVLTRTEKLTRFLRIIIRSIRLVTKTNFFKIFSHHKNKKIIKKSKNKTEKKIRKKIRTKSNNRNNKGNNNNNTNKNNYKKNLNKKK